MSVSQSLVEIQGQRVTYSLAGRCHAKGGGRRGIVSDFSNASRLKLMRVFAQVDLDKCQAAGVPLLFVTLTTTPDYWNRPGFVKQALRRLERQARRDFGDDFKGFIWKRELGEKRGMLHYHLVMFGPFLPELELRQWLAIHWTRALRSPVVLRVDVDEIRSADRIARYVAKYVAKAAYAGRRASADAATTESAAASTARPADAPLSKAHKCTNCKNPSKTWGRWWGVVGRDRIPWAPLEFLDEDETTQRALMLRFRRFARGWLKAQRKKAAENKLRNSELWPMLTGGGVSRVDRLRCVAEVRGKAGACRGFDRSLRRGGVGFTLFASTGLQDALFRAARDALEWSLDEKSGVVYT